MERSPCRPGGLAQVQPLTGTVKKEQNKKKQCFMVMNLEAMNQRQQVENRGPRDGKVSEDTDVADQERGEKTMGLFQLNTTQLTVTPSLHLM